LTLISEKIGAERVYGVPVGQPQLTAQTLMRLTPRLPAGWAEQRKLLGFR
jgi:hypothetical protein